MYYHLFFDKAWDWFGHKVQFSLDDASTFLFISSSGGWDGWQLSLYNSLLHDFFYSIF